MSESAYDSTEYSSLPEQLSHLRSNKADISNSSETYEIKLDDNTVLHIPSFISKIQGYLPLFESWATSYDLPEEYFYRPDLLARDLYGSYDLWYLVMLVSNTPYVALFDRSPIMVVGGDHKVDVLGIFKKMTLPKDGNVIAIENITLKEFDWNSL